MSPDRYRKGHRKGHRSRSVRLGNPGSWNRYAYVLDDPINHNDPRGRESCETDGGEDETCGEDTPTYYGDDDQGGSGPEPSSSSGDDSTTETFDPATDQYFDPTTGTYSSVPLDLIASETVTSFTNDTLVNAFMNIIQNDGLSQNTLSDIRALLSQLNLVPNGTVVAPLYPPFLGVQVDITYIPNTNELCISGGLALGTPAAGATIGAFVDPGNAAPNIVPGFSFGTGLQASFLGGLASTGSFGSPVIAGPTIGMKGVTVNASYGGCWNLGQ